MRVIEFAKKPQNPFLKEVKISSIVDERIVDSFFDSKLITQISNRIADKAKHRLFALSDAVRGEHDSLQIEIDLSVVADDKSQIDLILNIIEDKLKEAIRMEFSLAIGDLLIAIQVGSITNDKNGIKLRLNIDYGYNYSELFKCIFFFKTPEGQSRLGIRIKHSSLAKLSAKKISELINSLSALVEEYASLNLDQNNIEIKGGYVTLGLITPGFKRDQKSLHELFIFVQKVIEKFYFGRHN